MPSKTKTRSYESPRRREQAAETRLRILEAAERLFVADGYAPTSIAAITTEAGVSMKTVYNAFETKSGLLRALWNLRLRGDQGPAPVDQREWFTQALHEPDPKRQVKGYLQMLKKVRTRLGPLLAVIRDGAPADPEVAALWNRMQSEFHDNQRIVVESLQKKKALKRGLDVDRATDILWTLNHPTVFLLLVHDRGWALDQYVDWLEEVIEAQLLKA